MINNYIKTTFKIVLLFFTSLFFAQEYLDPIQKVSFGLNNHTNRDISFFNKKDSSGNIYNIGTTERDSSFIDIITSKFDINLNLIWQKKYSVDTELSFDIPLKTYVDSNNNLFIIGESSLSQSFYDASRFLFIVKYDPNGEELWHTTLGATDLSAYPGYVNFNSSFDNDVLRIIYNPIDWETSQGGNGTDITKYVRIENDGSVVEEYNFNFPNFGVESTYKNDIYYSLVRVDRPDGYSDYYIRKVGSGIAENYLLNDQTNYVHENFNQNINDTQLLVDNNENLYLIKPNSEGYGNSLSYTKVNKSGQIVYSKYTSLDYNLIGSYIDIDDRLAMVYEDTSQGKIISKKVDEQGNDFEILEFDYNSLSGSVFNDDRTFFIVNDNDIISLVNKDLSLVNSFNYSSTFQLTDITNINDSEIVVSGTTYEKMYPESDFFTQNDIKIEKLTSSEILKTYSYSGEGTSKAFQQKLLIDNDDNYIVISQEKLGPDNWSIGGSRAPINKSINKYDSNFNLLWRLEFSNELIGYDNAIIDLENNIYINTGLYGFGASEGYELIKISPEGNILFQEASFQNSTMYFDQNYNVNVVSFPTRNDLTFDDDTKIYTFDAISGSMKESKLYEGLQFIDTYKSQNGDFYIYMYTGPNSYGDTSPRIDVYKNLSLNFSINIAVTGTYGAAGSFEIAENGDLFFTSSWGQINEKFHKISLSGSYNYINIENEISELKILNNGKIFTIEKISSEKGKINVYNDNLTIFSNGSDVVYDHPEILEVNGYIWLNTHSYYGDVVEVFNQNNVKVDEFKIASSLNYSVFDSNKDIILTGQFGNQIYIFHEYSWARGLLHKYEYKGPQDSDGDGIGDNIDSCSNTPIGETIDSNGCSETQKDDDGDEIMNNVDQCSNTPSGEIVDLNGCSESQKDDDGDRVMNSLDECPNTVLTDLVNSKGCFELPSNNFTIKSIGETCPDKNNGKIIISAINNLNYIATFNGLDYTFTNILTIDNLSPGAYDFCIKVPLENYEQCYSINLEEGAAISGKTSVNLGKVSIEITKGTAPFNVSKNGVAQFYTNATSFSVDALYGDLIEVTTSKSCEGKLSKMVDLFDKVIASPNPTTDNFEITLPILNREVIIELYSIQSQLISTSKYKETNGKINMSLKDQPDGVYFIKVYLDEPVTLKIIKQ